MRVPRPDLLVLIHSHPPSHCFSFSVETLHLSLKCVWLSFEILNCFVCFPLSTNYCVIFILFIFIHFSISQALYTVNILKLNQCHFNTHWFFFSTGRRGERRLHRGVVHRAELALRGSESGGQRLLGVGYREPDSGQSAVVWEWQK